ncbi:hypothetical protein FA95DRAFT_1675771 [Auriscalpium vulgare]|uniref:Uncharacterized protein n=1 Tax=Auriscalpium vulgare TaxID=40419 RepID=A0ACB8S5K6_9AGAM|nr:hypothetical protein FA95DRAFT_1675771 [Auriscalpium vulgare]
MSTWTRYTFPVALSFSHNIPVGGLLADIPLFSVGLLGFAILTFFLILKKVNLALAFLFSSIILSFFAAILDLTQILLHNFGSDQPDSIGRLKIAREVFFAVATGVRFMYFWAFVAQCPRGEMVLKRNSPTGRRSLSALSFHSQRSLHSGDWQRWGIVGLVLQWVLMGIAVAIALLQILWRTLDSFHHQGPVYAVESALEIIASALLISKLLLNCMIAETPSRWGTFFQYSPIFVALIINAGLGSGNLAYFAFTESTLGRFFLAVEIYIVCVFSLVWVFYPNSPSPSLVPKEHKRASSFRGLRLSYGEIMGPMGPTDPILPQQRDPPRLDATTRMSSATRLSSWLIRRASGLSISGRNRLSPERDEKRLWSQDDAERAESPMTEKGGNTLTYEPSNIMTEAKQSARWLDPVYTSVMNSPGGASSPAAREPAPTPYRTGPISPISQPGRARTRSPSTASYYTEAAPGSPATVRPNAILPSDRVRRTSTDSPIFGLNGTLRAGYYSPADMISGQTSARSSGFSNLLREQTELEKSIAALRMFAPEASAKGPSGTGSGETDSSVNPTSLVGRGSVSGQSEFSLSIFPEPPFAARGNSEQVPSAEQISQSAQSADEMLAAARRSSVELIPPRMPAAMSDQTLPSSTRNSEDTLQLAPHGRSDSQGTRYDVTSFIGDLTTPGLHRVDNSFDSTMPNRGQADNDFEEPGSATVATATYVTLQRTYSKTQKLSMDGPGGRLPRIETNFEAQQVSSVPAAQPGNRSVTSPTAGPSRVADLSARVVSPVNRNVSPTNRLLAPSPSRGPLAPPTAYTRAPGARVVKSGGRVVGLPSGPKWGMPISGPTRQSEDLTTAYEQPRPAPGPR